MYLDKETQLSLAQASVRAAAAYFSTNCYDAKKSLGAQIYDGPFLCVRIGTAFAGGTSVKFELICSDTPWTDTAGAGATNVTVLAATDAILEAALTVNTDIWKLKLPVKIPKRYVGLRATGVGTHTAGDFDANIVPDVPVGSYS